ncbi:MAG: ABC transporter ATP-binding protein [Actinomycetota bacterium]|nr:ABC transporter ATP-binding protein [Actinomycetota bacterium]
MTFLEVRHVVAAYGRIRALHGVSLEVGAGEMTALIGANGAGKSTLLKVIVGALAPLDGRVHFDGRDVTGWPAHRRVRAGLVLVPEGRAIIHSMRVEENLLLGEDASGSPGQLDQVYERFPILGERRHLPAGLLSGGEQQMLAIARALLGDPRVLMLDEPSLGLAPIIARQIFQLLSQLRDEGMTVLLVEQNARQALRIADRCYVLESGRIAAEGEAALLREDPQVQASYLGGTTRVTGPRGRS